MSLCRLQEEEEVFDDGVELGRGGGFLQRREAEMRAAKEALLRQKLVSAALCCAGRCCCGVLTCVVC